MSQNKHLASSGAKAGTWVDCHAEEGKCPLGGQHADSTLLKKLKSEHGYRSMSEVTIKDIADYTDDLRRQLTERRDGKPVVANLAPSNNVEPFRPEATPDQPLTPDEKTASIALDEDNPGIGIITADVTFENREQWMTLLKKSLKTDIHIPLPVIKQVGQHFNNSDQPLKVERLAMRGPVKELANIL